MLSLPPSFKDTSAKFITSLFGDGAVDLLAAGDRSTSWKENMSRLARACESHVRSTDVNCQESMSNLAAKADASEPKEAGLLMDTDMVEMGIGTVSLDHKIESFACEIARTTFTDNHSAITSSLADLRVEEDQGNSIGGAVECFKRPTSPSSRQVLGRKQTKKLSSYSSRISKKLTSTRRNAQDRQAYLKFALHNRAVLSGTQSELASKSARRRRFSSIRNIIAEAVYPKPTRSRSADGLEYYPETDAEDTDTQQEPPRKPYAARSMVCHKESSPGPLMGLSNDLLAALPGMGESSTIIGKPAKRLPLQNFRLVRLAGKPGSGQELVTANNCSICGHTLDAFASMGGINEFVLANIYGTVTEHCWCAEKSRGRTALQANQNDVVGLAGEDELFLYTVSPDE